MYPAIAISTLPLHMEAAFVWSIYQRVYAGICKFIAAYIPLNCVLLFIVEVNMSYSSPIGLTSHVIHIISLEKSWLIKIMVIDRLYNNNIEIYIYMRIDKIY